MANEQNLIPTNKRSKAEARELGRAGGIKSGEARRLKAQGRKLLLELLKLKEPDERILKDFAAYGIAPEDVTQEVAIHLRQMQKAIRKADTNAYNAIMKTAGITTDTAEAPTYNLNVTCGTKEAAEGLRLALQTGAQPAKPADE